MENLLNELGKLSKTLTLIIAVLGSLWFFGKAPFENEVKKLIIQHTLSNDFQYQHEKLFENYLKSPEFEMALDKYIEDNNSNAVSFRHILSIKMNINEELVAQEIAELYNKDKKRLLNILRILSEKYPEESGRLWSVN